MLIHGLPFELKRTVARFCPRQALPQFALASKEMKSHAEWVLYESMIACHLGELPVGAISTLESNREKAFYVVKLNVELRRAHREARPGDDTFLESLLRVCPGLSSLKYLTLSVREDMLTPPNVDGLNALLCGGYFRLVHLFIDEPLYLPNIMDSQPELEVLGVFRGNTSNTPLSLGFSFEGRSLLLVVMTRRVGLFPCFNKIRLYPDLMNLKLAKSFHEALIGSWDNEAGRSIRFDPEYVMTLNVHLRSTPTQDIFHAFMASAACVFNLGELAFHLQGNMIQDWMVKTLERFPTRDIEVVNWTSSPTEGTFSRVLFHGLGEEVSMFVRK